MSRSQSVLFGRAELHIISMGVKHRLAFLAEFVDTLFLHQLEYNTKVVYG